MAALAAAEEEAVAMTVTSSAVAVVVVAAESSSAVPERWVLKLNFELAEKSVVAARPTRALAPTT